LMIGRFPSSNSWSTGKSVFTRDGLDGGSLMEICLRFGFWRRHFGD
jgi:hypothetical protein